MTEDGRTLLGRLPGSDREIARKRGHKFQYNYVEHRVASMVGTARKRANRLGIPFALKKRDLVMPDLCPILGIPIKTEQGPFSETSATLDRIVPSLGYVRGNVAVISGRANRLKNDGTADEHRAIADYMDRMTQTQSTATCDVTAAAKTVAEPLVCLVCGAPISERKIRHNPNAHHTGLCRSCGMRKAWQDPAYVESIMAARMRRRKVCPHCKAHLEPGRTGRFHPECWAEIQSKGKAERLGTATKATATCFCGMPLKPGESHPACQNEARRKAAAWLLHVDAPKQ